MLYDLAYSKWVLIRLNEPAEKTLSGTEEGWAPRTLSSQYLSLAQGNQLGVWETVGTWIPKDSSPPIPLRTQNGTPYFVLHSNHSLKVCDQKGQETELSTRWFTDSVALLSVRPTYLVGIDPTEEAILAREELVSTGIGMGVASPHTKSSDFNKFFVVVGIQKESGIE